MRTPFARPRHRSPVWGAALLTTALAGCGATQRLDDERIRQNAQQADQDLDRESAKEEKDQ